MNRSSTADREVTALDTGEQLLRPEDVQRILRVGRSKVYEMIAEGELPVIRIGRAVRIPRGELERWIAERTSGGQSNRAA
jgi:excisionase family DNA binding protein